MISSPDLVIPQSSIMIKAVSLRINYLRHLVKFLVLDTQERRHTTHKDILLSGSTELYYKCYTWRQREETMEGSSPTGCPCI